MAKDWQDLYTIQDALDYCRQRAAHYSADMGLKEKEHIASTILPFSFSERLDEWAKNYPVVHNIEALALDLEWSNSSDIDDDWGKLLAYIEQLDREVNCVQS